MTDTPPVGSPMFAVDRAARLMLVCARRDPGLLARSGHQQPDDDRDSVWDVPALFHWRPNLANPNEGFSGELYLEELVSIAAEAAERAGDASRQAAAATVALRHSRLAFALLGALGMAIGLGAAAGSIWNAEQRQARIAGDLAAVQALQQRADQQLVALVTAQNHPAPPVLTAAAAPHAPDVAPQTADAVPQTVAPQTAEAAIVVQPAAVVPQPPPSAPQAAAIDPLPRLHATNISARQQWSATPVDVPESEVHAPVLTQPPPGWGHRHHRPVRRVYRYYQPRQPVLLVRVVQNIQRDVGSLFR